MNEWPKSIATAAIWLTIGFALGVGLFRMNFGDPGVGIILLLYVPALLVFGATICTWIIWRRPRPDAKREG